MVRIYMFLNNNWTNPFQETKSHSFWILDAIFQTVHEKAIKISEKKIIYLYVKYDKLVNNPLNNIMKSSS